MSDRFISTLVEFGSESDENKAALVALKATCMQRILDGGGEISTELSGSLNGQVYTFQVHRPVDQLVADVSDALRELDNDGPERSTRFDFRFIQH